MEFIKDLGTRTMLSGLKARYYLCKCKMCNIEKEVLAENHKKAKGEYCSRCTKIQRNTTHGFSKEKSYLVWRNMLQRCYNPKSINYKRWGGRGIVVCDEWKDNFISFKNWFDSNYKNGCQIDRIDNDGNYEPSNCRFVSPSENIANNSKGNKLSKYRYIRLKRNKWEVTFRSRYLGVFATEEEAFARLCQEPDYVVTINKNFEEIK